MGITQEERKTLGTTRERCLHRYYVFFLCLCIHLLYLLFIESRDSIIISSLQLPWAFHWFFKLPSRCLGASAALKSKLWVMKQANIGSVCIRFLPRIIYRNLQIYMLFFSLIKHQVPELTSILKRVRARVTPSPNPNALFKKERHSMCFEKV